MSEWYKDTEMQRYGQNHSPESPGQWPNIGDRKAASGGNRRRQMQGQTQTYTLIVTLTP